jgi:hypothetical protein
MPGVAADVVDVLCDPSRSVVYNRVCVEVGKAARQPSSLDAWPKKKTRSKENRHKS